MTEIPYAIAQPFNSLDKKVLKEAKKIVFGDEPTQFRRTQPGPGVLGFGLRSGVTTLSSNQIATVPFPERYLAVSLAKLTGYPKITPWSGIIDDDKVLYFDIESHDAELIWSMEPRDFFRLGQWAWGPTGEVHLTDDYDEFMAVMAQAHALVGQNIHAFDLTALFGKDSIEPLLKAQKGRVFDTLVYAALALPAPTFYHDRNGRKRLVDSPEDTLGWLGLDNLCYQLGLDGKVGSLKELAEEFGGYGNIPTDDPRYREYARGDITALQELTTALLIAKKPDAYDWREQLNAAIDAQNSRNGFRVDIAAATRRRDELAARKEEILAMLHEKYDFPTDGAMPWRTTAGKNAILKVLAENGITPETRPDWEKTKTGNISLGGKVLVSLTEGTPAEDIGKALAEVMGHRSLSQLTLDCVQPDGKVHPEISAVQRSGRKSTTNPGLTVWTSRGEGAVEKSYYIPDNENERLVAFDYSQADARIVAAYSGDVEYAKRFEEGVDSHELTGRLIFTGEEVEQEDGTKFFIPNYDDDPENNRKTAKNLGHAYSYRAGEVKLSWMAKVPLPLAQKFVRAMKEAYPDVTRWQDEAEAEGRQGTVTNDWGRVMLVSNGKAYTQAPALYGQSGTREIMVDALIRMLEFDVRLITWLKAQVHDELIFSIPVSELDWAVPKIKELMEVKWRPREGGQEMFFAVSHGEPAMNWMEATHD